MNKIQQKVLDSVPGKKKTTQKGWVSFNAVCCHHRGERQDRRMRGGINPSSNGISYHCFNCNFKASWQPGRHISYNMRKLLSWMNVPEREVRLLVLDAIRLRDEVEATGVTVKAEVEYNFKTIALPESVPVMQLDAPTGNEYDLAYDYLKERCIDNKEAFWCPDRLHRFNKRIIIPFYHKGNIVGYSARAFDNDVIPRYYMSTPVDYVYNLDNQTKDREFVLVFEGVIDALTLDGVGLQSNELSEGQVDQIDALGKHVIVVPDNDKAGQVLIKSAIEYGWSVSFPEWFETCKDVNFAVQKYGKLYVVKSILDNVEVSNLKIRLRAKRMIEE